MCVYVPSPLPNWLSPVAGLERKISMRTSKEELIQRGILLPGDTTVAATSPLPASSSRPASPRLNLPQLVNNNKSGRRPGDGGHHSRHGSHYSPGPSLLCVPTLVPLLMWLLTSWHYSSQARVKHQQSVTAGSCCAGVSTSHYPSVHNSATFPMLLLKSSKEVVILNEISSK